MAYKDYNGKIMIDEVAANNDIKKLRQAIGKLEESKNAINQVIYQGNQTKGAVGTAIVTKGNELKGQLQSLINNLNSEISSINQTVAKYKRLDQEVKAIIMKK